MNLLPSAPRPGDPVTWIYGGQWAVPADVLEVHPLRVLILAKIDGGSREMWVAPERIRAPLPGERRGITFLRGLAMVLAMVLVGCGGGSTTPTIVPTPAPTPTPAARSVLTLGVEKNTFTVTSYAADSGHKCGDFHSEWIIAETPGLRAKVIQSDAYLLSASGDIWDRRITNPATDWDSPWVPASGRITVTNDRWACGYDDEDFPFVLKVAFDLEDARGNTHRLSGETGFIER